MCGPGLAFILVAAVTFRPAGGTLPLILLAVRLSPPTLVLLLIVYYRWRRERRIVGLLTVVFWSCSPWSSPLNVCATEGIISFPSFHTILALLALPDRRPRRRPHHRPCLPRGQGIFQAGSQSHWKDEG
jgi:hypothetical protein